MKMGKRWLCFLALCAVLCVPALASEAAPYTIHGVTPQGKFTVTFSAVSVGEATVTVFDPFGGDGASLHSTTLPVTLLTPAPGCKVAIPQATEFVENEPCIPALSANGNLWRGFAFPTDTARARNLRLTPGNMDDWEDDRGLFIDAKPLTTAGAWGEEVYLFLKNPVANPSRNAQNGYSTLFIEGGNVTGANCVLAFESVKTEAQSVLYRGDESDYAAREMTVVKVRPGSRTYVYGGNMNGADWGGDLYVECGEADGGNRYTFRNGGAWATLFADVLAAQSPRGDFYNVYQSQSQCWTLGGNHDYLIQLDTESGFEDVGASAYFACPVVWAVSGGVTNGVWASSFAPHNTCTRAQILTFIWRYSGSPEPAIANPFKDVSPDNYYYKPALWAHEQGMITGREFQGSTLCTRAAAVQYLWILAGRPSVGEGKTFSDVSPGAEYAQAVSYAAERGITAGTSETEFSPNNTCTRAQIVTFLYRYHAFG